MALKRPKGPAGTLVVLEHTSQILKENPLGDPHVRKVAVWLPPQYDGFRGRRRFPVLYDLVGFTGSGLAHTNWKPFGDNVPERAARLIHEQKMGPAIFVFPDCFTALGGNQYVNSSAIGNYADYLTREIIPFVDREFRTLAGPGASRLLRQVLGRLRRDHPRHEVREVLGRDRQPFGRRVFRFRLLARLAEHARTSSPSTACRSARPAPTTRAARRAARASPQGLDDGRIKRFLDHVWKKEKLSTAEGHCIMNLCMAATYDPDPRAPLGFRVPFNLESGEVIEKRWRKWREHDPINLVAQYRDNLKSLRGIYIDCGWRDQYHIHYGSRILSKRLAAAGIRHTYEEFDDNHSDIDYRMDVSLPFLYKALR